MSEEAGKEEVPTEETPKVESTPQVEDTRTVHLISQEGESFEVPAHVAKVSELVKTMIDEDQDVTEVQEIPLPNVSSSTLAKVIEFCKQQVVDPVKTIEKPMMSLNMAELVQEFYANYVEVDKIILFEVMLAANYMDIKPLLELCCAGIARLIKGKSPEEIRTLFEITSEFTPEEEAQVREENKWCEESS